MTLRVRGITLPENKTLYSALLCIYGIGHYRAQSIAKLLKLNPSIRVNDISAELVAPLINAIEAYTIEIDLRNEVKNSIYHLIHNGSYRGTRHIKGYPSRGQRTHTNASTAARSKKY